jgi:hypothetical protein
MVVLGFKAVVLHLNTNGAPRCLCNLKMPILIANSNVAWKCKCCLGVLFFLKSMLFRNTNVAEG